MGWIRSIISICDTTGLCDVGSVSVTVSPVDDPPVAVASMGGRSSGGAAVVVDVAVNDDLSAQTRRSASLLGPNAR